MIDSSCGIQSSLVKFLSEAPEAEVPGAVHETYPQETSKEGVVLFSGSRFLHLFSEAAGQVNTLQTVWLETLWKQFPWVARLLWISNPPTSKLQTGSEVSGRRGSSLQSPALLHWVEREPDLRLRNNGAGRWSSSFFFFNILTV